MPSDVTAVLLTMGEPTTGRALESVRRQTLAPAETIVVEGVSPFYAAISTAVEQVRTPFFVQVDADMILDDTCIERLRAAVTPEVGIACGGLRDPLLGTIGAVKLFRRECFDIAPMPDSVSQDIDFYLSIGEHGWLTLYALTLDRPGHTFGEHRPDWSDEYTYATYHLLGSRYRRLRRLPAVLWRLGALRRSRHPMATVARYALCTGLFHRVTRDVGKSSVPIDRPLLDALAHGTAQPISTGPGTPGPGEWFGLGRALGEAHAHEQLIGRLLALAPEPIRSTWPAEVGLCYGFSRGLSA